MKTIVVKNEYQRANLSKRFIAYLFDWYIGALLTGLPISLISQKLNGNMYQQNLMVFSAPLYWIAGVTALIIAFIYFVVIPTWLFPGQTIGKRIFRLKIVNEQLKDTSFKNIIIRNGLGIIVIEGSLVSASTIWHQLLSKATGIDFVTIFMYLGFIMTGVSLLMMFVKKDQQALHDYLSHTQVVEQKFNGGKK